MSADWKAAEHFAGNLLQDLAELERVLPAWQQDAIASQEANVEELTRRIEDFISFRTELVRLAREESVAAARVFGDNDINRSGRIALNRSLETLARSYGQEMERARGAIEAGDRRFMVALIALAALAGVVLCGGFVLVGKSLLRPLLRLRTRMLQLAAGDLDAPVEGRQSAAEIAEMARAVELFRTELIDRQRRRRETALLSALNDWLQSCGSLGELYDMVGAYLVKLLPSCSGSLFIYANSRDVLESAKAWNGGPAIPTMNAEDCWGLRRGRTYTFGEQEIDFPCSHVGAGYTKPYCCIPILAHGETIGLLHLEFGAGDDAVGAVPTESEIAEQRRLGTVSAEQISLAIANVKLRDRLRDQSIRDPLTGLFNRRYLMETCRREFARAVRASHGVGLLSLDIDHFKKYNNNHGHDAGDLVLRAVGGCMESLFRAEDVPCRFGGEEFVVTLPGANLESAARRAEHLRQSVEAIRVRYLDQDLPRVTVSIGVAVFPEAGDTPEAVLKAADEALYRAKAGGRNRIELAASPAEIQPSTEANAAAVTDEPLSAAADG
jgi:diguanylate cyclase (GGDEF)-like protein